MSVVSPTPKCKDLNPPQDRCRGNVALLSCSVTCYRWKINSCWQFFRKSAWLGDTFSPTKLPQRLPTGLPGRQPSNQRHDFNHENLLIPEEETLIIWIAFHWDWWHYLRGKEELKSFPTLFMSCLIPRNAYRKLLDWALAIFDEYVY